MVKGWIKLHRQSTENFLYNAEPFDKFHAWVDLLLMVNHEHKEFYSKGQLLKLEPGQMVTSHRILAERWGWSRNKVSRFLKLLNEATMCNVVEAANGTTITVINWGKYQNQRATDGATNGTTLGATDEATDETITRSKEVKKKERGGGFVMDPMLMEWARSVGKHEV